MMCGRPIPLSVLHYRMTCHDCLSLLQSGVAKRAGYVSSADSRYICCSFCYFRFVASTPCLHAMVVTVATRLNQPCQLRASVRVEMCQKAWQALQTRRDDRW